MGESHVLELKFLRRMEEFGYVPGSDGAEGEEIVVATDSGQARLRHWENPS